MKQASDLWTSFCRTLYPPKCALCNAIGTPPVCPFCEAELLRLKSDFESGPDEPYKSVTAAFSYEGRAAQAVRRLKYSRETALSAWMSAAMLEVAAPMVDHADLILPVPIHWTRTAHRGFNQALELCSAFPAEKIRPNLLVRQRATRTQVGLSVEARLANLEGAFVVRESVQHCAVILVDDVLTSGQTAKSCTDALLLAGANKVDVVVFAAANPSAS